MAKKEKKDKEEKPEKGAKKGKANSSILMAAALLMGVVFLPTTLLLFLGMLPSIVVFLADQTKGKPKALTVGAMNLAGAMPFVLELWIGGNSFEKSFEIIMDLRAMIIIYVAAAIGYLIDWALTGVVSTVLVQRGHARKKAIKKRQEDLVERWGVEVTGDLPLDDYGFPIIVPSQMSETNKDGEISETKV